MKAAAVCATVFLMAAPSSLFCDDDFSRIFNVYQGDLLVLCETVNAGATSTLKGPVRNPNMYEPNNVMDGDPKTMWVEGAEGPGIGEELIFDIPAHDYSSALLRGATSIKVLNGCTLSQKLFNENNRVKEFSVTLFVGVSVGVDDQYCDQYSLKEYKRFDLKLADTMEFQKFALGVDFDDSKSFWRAARDELRAKGVAVDEFEYGRYVFASLKIKSVYKGAKYDDTCISEISFE
jgi:hypothetical protein